MSWNFDMSQAPKGHTEEVDRRIGSHVTKISRHVPVQIIAAGNGGVVTVSRWLPDEGRWNMFTAAVPPIAWMPWPDHPNGGANDRV